MARSEIANDCCKSLSKRMAKFSPLPRVKILAKCNSAGYRKPTLIVPDKDADGLSSGVIVHRTLVKLGLDPNLLDIHLVQKGSNIHEEDERKLMSDKKPAFIIVLD
jgi:single-stranded DNA-specific DHH superfamily exonuclease